MKIQSNIQIEWQYEKNASNLTAGYIDTAKTMNSTHIERELSIFTFNLIEGFFSFTH